MARVTIVRALYSRFEHIVHELSKFGTVGAIALVVNMTVFNVMLVAIEDKQIVATVVSTLVATVVAYLGNRHWTYRDRDKMDRGREMFFFFLINGVAAVIEVVAVFIAKYGVGEDGPLAVNIAKYGFGLPLGMLFRLITYRTWVFPQTLVVEPEYIPPAAFTPLFPQSPPLVQPHAVHPPHVYPQPVVETATH